MSRAFARLASFCWLSIAACTAQPPLPTGEAYSLAVEHANVGDADRALAALQQALDEDPDAYARALLDPAFAETLRDTQPFRDALHEAAVRHRIHHLVLTPADEPGQPLTIRGQVVEPDGTPHPGAVARVFTTDAEGRYHPTLEGEEWPRLFGTVVSDPDGRFVIETVRPGPYAGTRNAIHVHISVRSADGRRRLNAPYYMVFDDDPLLYEPQNAEQRGEALRIAMDSAGTHGTLVLPLR